MMRMIAAAAPSAGQLEVVETAVEMSSGEHGLTLDGIEHETNDISFECILQYKSLDITKPIADQRVR
jgi:hypothetical protein